MKPGLKKVQTYALLNESQRNEILLYVSNPKPGTKGRLLPRPEGQRNVGDGGSMHWNIGGGSETAKDNCVVSRRRRPLSTT